MPIKMLKQASTKTLSVLIEIIPKITPTIEETSATIVDIKIILVKL